MLKNRLRLAMMAAYMLGAVGTVRAATTGSCEKDAYPIAATAGGNKKTVALTKEYDEWDGSYSSESYVYYFKTTFQRGQSYTIDIKIESEGEKVWSVDLTPDVMELDVKTEVGDSSVGAAYDYRFVVTPQSWSGVDSDAASVVCYLLASGESGGKFTAKFYTGALGIPEGTEANPKLVVPREGFETVAGTLTEDHLGNYIFTSFLSGGRRYRFRTKSGTEDLPLTMIVEPDTDAVRALRTEDGDVDTYNAGYFIMPTEDGYYSFTVEADGGTNTATASSVTLEYGTYPQRTMADHPTTNLALTISQTFTPGHRNAAGSDFYDAIIDETLFAFEATSGKRYVVYTHGAATNLVMELYDRWGETIAVNRGQTAATHDMRIAWTATASDTYYIGVAEDVADDEPLSGAPLEIVVAEADTLDAVQDAWDPVDDVPQTAPLLSPVYTASGNPDPALVDVAGHGPHTLSARDWSDTFALAVRTGYTYALRAIKAKEAEGTFLSASVFALSGSSEVPVETVGDIEYSLRFTATENAMYYVRIVASDPKTLRPAQGLDGGPYTLHATATSEDATPFGILSVKGKGPAPSDGATWRISSGTSEYEPDYAFGTEVPVAAGTTVELSFSSVGGMTTPPSTNVTITAGQTNQIVVVYSDTYDPDDDNPDGATWMYVRGDEEQVASRTLWKEDPADYFKFSGSAGTYYNFRLTETTGEPYLEIVDTDKKVLVSGAQKARLGVTDAGTYYVRVVHKMADAPVDSTYCLTAFSDTVGLVAFADNAAFMARKGTTNAILRVARTSSEGALRVRWATYADTATPGEDYVPATGELVWADGDGTTKEIAVRLIPDRRSENEGNERFFVRLAPIADELLAEDEYPALIEGSAVATVTIEDTAPSARGVVAFVACGPKQMAFPEDGLRVAPGETCLFWVGRSGGSNGTAAVSFSVTNTAGTAWGWSQPVAWVSGNADLKCLDVRIPEGIKDAQTLTLRLVSADDTTITSNDVLRVVVDPTLQQGNAGTLPPLGELAERGSVYGTFRAVLAEENGVTNGVYALADLRLEATTNGLSATVCVAGRDMTFTARRFDANDGDDWRRKVTMTNDAEIAGHTYEQTLRLELPNIMEKDWDPTNLEIVGEAELHLYLPADDGISAEEAVYVGMVRRDNYDMVAYKVAAAAFVGHYTTGLMPDEVPLPDEPKGNGFCLLDIDVDGSVALQVELASGRTFRVDSRIMPLELGRNVAVIPFYWQEGTALFGGEILLAENDDGTIVVDTDAMISERDISSPIIWRDGGIEATLDGTRTLEQTFHVVGGRFDAAFDPEAVIFGRAVTALTEGYDFFFGDNWNDIGIVIDRRTGLTTGTVNVGGMVHAFRGVNIQATVDARTFDGLFVVGALANPTTNAVGNAWADSYPLNVYLEKTDNDWTEDFGFTSSITFDGNGNTAGSAPATIVDEVGQVRTIPVVSADFARNGYEFLGWTDGVRTYHEGDIVAVPVTNLTLRADWTLSVKGVDTAFDTVGRTFRAGGDAAWYAQNEVVKVGVDALRSGEIADGQSTWIETTVDGPGVLSFWYKISSEQNYDKLVVAVDGVVATNFSGEAGWERSECEITSAGRHTVRWTYQKDASGERGEDAAWLDGFVFGPKLWNVSFDLAGGTAAVNTNRLAVTGTAVVLPTAEEYGLAKEGYEFIGWILDDTIYKPGASYTVDTSDVAFTAAWSFSVSDVAKSLGLPASVTLLATGDAAWFDDGQTVSSTGKSAVRSGRIAHNAQTALSLSFEGPGELAFQYKVSSERNYDKFTIVTNGVSVGEFSGEIDWTVWTGTFPGGRHTIVFEYVKDGSSDSGSDAAWLTEVRWTPDRTMTETNAVPFAWLDKVWPSAIGSDATAYEELAERVPSPFGKAVPLSYDYIAGTDPNDKDDFLRVAITLVDGKPKVTWMPDLGTARTYKLLAKQRLDHENWEEISSETEGYYFFKVSVSMPIDE